MNVDEEEIRERRRRHQEARRRNLDTAPERHAAELAKLDGKLREVLDLHQPDVISHADQGEPFCYGCDPGWYAEGPAYWPCQTWALITGEDQEQWSPK
jgi:hypothetical protein